MNGPTVGMRVSALSSIGAYPIPITRTTRAKGTLRPSSTETTTQKLSTQIDRRTTVRMVAMPRLVARRAGRILRMKSSGLFPRTSETQASSRIVTATTGPDGMLWTPRMTSLSRARMPRRDSRNKPITSITQAS